MLVVIPLFVQVMNMNRTDPLKDYIFSLFLCYGLYGTKRGGGGMFVSTMTNKVVK